MPGWVWACGLRRPPRVREWCPLCKHPAPQAPAPLWGFSRSFPHLPSGRKPFPSLPSPRKVVAEPPFHRYLTFMARDGDLVCQSSSERTRSAPIPWTLPPFLALCFLLVSLWLRPGLKMQHSGGWRRPLPKQGARAAWAVMAHPPRSLPQQPSVPESRARLFVLSPDQRCELCLFLQPSLSGHRATACPGSDPNLPPSPALLRHLQPGSRLQCLPGISHR